MQHPAVLESAAVESPDPIRGRVIKAFIVLRADFQSGPELMSALQTHARNSMAPYKYPRKIEFVAALPKTTSGKIKRRELREAEFR
jgi:acyl-coenzyme A synthetase/AMP-(fatty) acid ligase